MRHSPDSRGAVTSRWILVVMCAIATLGVLGFMWSAEREAEAVSSAEKPALGGPGEAATDSRRDVAQLTGSPQPGEGRAAPAQASQLEVSEVVEEGAQPSDAPVDATIQGRVMLMDGFALADSHVFVEPKRGTTTSCRTNAEGEFLLTVERDVSYRVALARMVGKASGASIDVIAPASGVTLRVDALLLRMWASAEAEPIELDTLSVRPMGGAATGFGQHFSLGGLLGDGQCIELLVPTGAGYLVVGLRDVGRPLVGVVESGLLSGVVDVELRESHTACATVGVVVAGQPLSPPNSVLLTLYREGSKQSWTHISAVKGHSEAWSGAILPGRYTLDVRVSGVPPFGWSRARTETTELLLAAGDVRAVDVELIPAGSLSVEVSVPEPELAKGAEPVITVEVFDTASEQWHKLSMHVRTPDGGRSVSSNVAPSVLHHSEELFEAGELRVRASAPGWRTVEGVVDVHAGRENEWSTALEREG